MKIRNKIIISVLAVSIPLILISGFFIYNLILQHIMKDVENSLTMMAKIQAFRINLLFDGYIDNMKMIENRTSTKKRLVQYLETKNDVLRTQITETLFAIKNSVPSFHKISVFDLSGNVIASTDKAEIGKNYNKDFFLVKGFKGCNIVDVFLGEDGNLDLNFSCPLILDGRQLGSVSAIMDGSRILEITNDFTNLGKTGETVLAKRDSNGDALFITPTRHDKEAAFKRRVLHTDDKLLITQALQKNSSMFREFFDYRGVAVLGATYYLYKMDLGLVIKIDKSEFLEPLFRIKKLMILSYIILLTMITLILVIIVDRIVKPLRKLKDMTIKISEGLNYRTVEINAKDEIGALSKYFNHMTENLHSTRMTLFNTINELQTNNIFLLAVLDCIQDGIVACDHNSNLKLFNKAFEEFHGLPAKTLPPEKWADYYNLYHADGKTKMSMDALPLYKALNGEGLTNYEMVIAPKDRPSFIILVNSRPLTDHDGNRIGAIASMHNITEEKKLSDELKLQSEIMTNLNEGVVLVSTADGNIVYCNPAYNRMFDYDTDELIGKNISIVHAPTEKKPNEAATEIQEFLRQHNCWTGEMLNIKKTGKTFWCYVTISTFTHNKYGEVWIGVNTDITERKKAEDNFRRFFELSSGLLVIATVDGYFKLTSPSMQKALGYTALELTSKPFVEFIHPDDREITLKEIANVAKGIPLLNFENRYRCKNGTYRHLSWLVQPVLEDEIVFATAHDITQMKALEQTLIDTNIKLSATVKELSIFDRQHELIAKLGLRALSGDDLQILMDRAVLKVTEALDVGYCQVLQLLPDGDKLLLVSGVGWKEGLVGRATVSADINSQAGFVLKSKIPVRLLTCPLKHVLRLSLCF